MSQYLVRTKNNAQKPIDTSRDNSHRLSNKTFRIGLPFIMLH